MFEDLFARPSTVEHYRSSPLFKERLAFLDHCEQLGIKPATLRKIAAQQLKLVRLLDLKDDELNARRIEAGFRRWLLPGRRRLQPKARQRFLSCSERWLRFLGWLEKPRIVGHGHTSQVATFAASMSGERGWSDTTIDSCCRTVDRFFVGLDKAGLDLASVEITTIDEAIARYHARGYARSTIHLYAQQLRTFFRFAEQQGWCSPGLADGIMPPRRHPGNAIPKGLNRDEVIRLLASTEGDRPFDIRARAIVMLLITYGLRAGEVCGLRLDDLDWEREMVRVRCPKPGRTHLYPLSRGVGQTILRYLREVRPVHPERRVFLTLKAPIKPLSREVITCIVSIRLERLGITDKRRGPHALRHAAAQHLLDQGLSMKAVGDYLGHRSVAATSVYAQVQLHALREVANIDLEGPDMILRDAIDHYVAWRRAHGARFITSARALCQFCKSVPEQVCCDAVTEMEVRRFLAGSGPLTRWRANKYGALAGFYRYAISRGYATRSPLPPPDEEPKSPPSAPPYIYSREELQRLFGAVEISRKHAIRFDADTFRTLLFMLYGAGLRTSEALRLSLRDVDLAEAVLTVRNTKFFKSRLVPLAPKLASVLEAYAHRRADRPLPERMDSTFLANRDGTMVRKHNVDHAFARLLEIAGIARRDDRRRAPCLHSFRHTAAVHRLTSWYRKGLDVQGLLPVLSTYLGHANLDGTSVYLSMTPDLLHEASVRFNRYVNGGDHA